MAKKKRPGLKAPAASTTNFGTSSRHDFGKSTRHGMSSGKSTHSAISGASTRSGMSGTAAATRRGSHDGSVISSSAAKQRRGSNDGSVISGVAAAKRRGSNDGSVISTPSTTKRRGSNDWGNRSTASGYSDDGGLDARSTMSSKKSGQSMRTFLKSANSVGSGLGGGGSNHSGHHKLTHKQKKARPGLAVMPEAMSKATGLGSGGSGHSRGSAHSGGKRSLERSGHSVRSGGTSPPASRHNKSVRHVPQPPEYLDEDEYEEEEEYDEFAAEEPSVMTMPTTEEEIRQGLHTEHVTKGFFRKKVRSIKWYSADIDKVDAGNYEAQETIQEEDEEESEYETDSDDDSQEHVDPDPWYIALGRCLLLLEKKGEETTPIKRWLRFLTWLTFFCDATGAIVSLVQFSTVQTCCNRPILNLGGVNINWQTVIRYATIFYLILILLEVYPVLRRGFPFNIVNPIIGFMITFALFFDDSYLEALIMWCIETCAVLSEFACYRVKIRQVNMRAIEIKKLMPKTTKKKESFEDEDEYLKELHKARRRYYVLKQEQRMDQRLLQYLHVAVYMNIIMSSIVLMLILVIARNGGLCIVNFDYPNPFASAQLERCTLAVTQCEDPSDKCEYCDDVTETYQCYFPYN